MACLGLWLANKTMISYINFRSKQQELDRLRVIKGEKLLVKHADKQGKLALGNDEQARHE